MTIIEQTGWRRCVPEKVETMLGEEGKE